MGPPQSELVALGAVGRPHGVRGELRVTPFNPDSTLLLELGEVVLRRPDGTDVYEIESARTGPKGIVLMRLVGVEGRDAAESLRGAELCVPRGALPELEGEWYHVDLVGLRVIDETGREWGTVSRVITYPTVDCLAVDRSDGGSLEVPMMEPWLEDVDLAAGVVRAKAIEELLEEP